MTLSLSSCATPPPADDAEATADYRLANDPLEPTNRVIFAANDALFTSVLLPVADRYREVVPPFGRRAVVNVVANLKSPTILLNDVLQGNFSRAGTTLTRLVLNSSFGFFGVVDVATPMGLPGHSADLGQTFGVWGVGEGPYLVIPLFGPSDLRDGAALAVSSVTDPLGDYWAANHMMWLADVRYGASLLAQVDSNKNTLDDIKRSSLDYYASMRSLYRQYRKAEIDGSSNPDVGWMHFMPHLTEGLY